MVMKMGSIFELFSDQGWKLNRCLPACLNRDRLLARSELSSHHCIQTMTQTKPVFTPPSSVCYKTPVIGSGLRPVFTPPSSVCYKNASDRE